MSLVKEDVRKLIDVYIRAWTTQDPDLILTIFTPTATYHERVLQQPIRDHAGIREYWQTKVVKEQSNIHAELLSLYLDGTTAIAEWEARFDDAVEGGNGPTFRDKLVLDHLLFDLPPGWTAARRIVPERYGSDHQPVMGLIVEGGARS